MTCYDCGRQPGDLCKREDGCTAQDAPIHSALATRPAAPAEPVALRDEAYDKIDRYLRNNLDDEDYADYSAALDALYECPAQPADAQADMVLVPRVPTAAMLDAAMALDKQARDGIAHSYQDLWDAMIAAAKEAP